MRHVKPCKTLRVVFDFVVLIFFVIVVVYFFFSYDRGRVAHRRNAHKAMGSPRFLGWTLSAGLIIQGAPLR